MSTRITQRELENYLWGAAIVLRGLIDAGDYKQYIFPLVFLKRISDVYDEEHAAAMEVYNDEELADLPENHRFAIPDGCHWDDIRDVTQNIGATLLHAMRSIEKANPDTLPESSATATGATRTCSRTRRWPTSSSTSPPRRCRSQTCLRTSSATATST